MKRVQVTEELLRRIVREEIEAAGKEPEDTERAAHKSSEPPKKTRAKSLVAGGDLQVDWGGLDEEEEPSLAREKTWHVRRHAPDGRNYYLSVVKNAWVRTKGEATLFTRAQALRQMHAHENAGLSRKKSPIDVVEAVAPKLTLTEGVSVSVVYQDNRGPYVIAGGVEARPGNPNQTQYKAGSKVRVYKSGKKGLLVFEMPNGERWVGKRPLKEAPKR